jgi:DNA modification methylase
LQNLSPEKFTPKQLVTDVNIICADSTSEIAKEKVKARLDIMGEDKAQLVILHPPYDDIIKFSDKPEDLSNCENTEVFYDMFEKVAKNGYDLLEKGRFAALIIGDSYKNSEVQPLGFECMARMMKLGFRLKAIIVKDIQGNEKAKGKTANLWRYRALAGGFYIFKHEYVMVFQKV